MAVTLTNSTFSTTYKDDFADSDHYHRILFNSGRTLQARELTQMQTIINREIERFGSNIFKEGGVVRAGNITLNTTYEFIKLNTAAPHPLPDDPSTLVGKVLTSSGQNIKVRVIEVVEATGSDPATLYVRYEDTSGGTAGTSPVRVQNGVLLTNPTLDNDLKVAASNATGTGTTISVDNGDYFIQGHFVFVERQTIFVSKYTSTPSADIGFKITEDVVTVDDTTALYDNQGEVPNIAAPGADRYRISLTLSKRSDLAADDNFVYLLRVDNGVITDESSFDDAYNKINDVLALRTREESGDYVVKPFIAKFNSLDDSNLQLEVTSGVAYVDGYRLDVPASKITVPKAQETISLTDQNVIVQYGNWVAGNGADNKGLPDIDTLQQVNLRNDSSYGGSTIGTARVRAVEEFSGTTYKYYLLDINMNPGALTSAIRSFGTGASDYTNIVLQDGQVGPFGTADNSLLFPLPNENPTFDGITLGSNAITVLRRYTITSTAGTDNIQSDDDGHTAGTFTNTGDWIIAKTDGSVETGLSFTLNNGGADVDIIGLDGSSTYEVLAYVSPNSPAASDKNLVTNRTITKLWPDSADSDGNGLLYINLGRPDVYRVKAIKKNDSDGADLSSSFIFDNGQRDNFYALGRLVKRGGVGVPSGNIYVKYDHFEINTQRDFFSVKSYQNEVGYESIPTHRKNNGETVALRNVLDFRPYQDSTGGFLHTQIHHLPQVSDLIGTDAVYYQPRKDRLVATVQNSRDGRIGRGDLKVVQGVSSLDPKFPEIPTGSIPLYDITLNAYTLNDSDVETSFYDNRRYTMKDIARLEKRIDDLTELTTLSLLEANTSTFAVFDSAGFPRTKAGFIADAFSNYAFSDVNRSEYRAAIDPVENILTTRIYPNNLRIKFDSDQSTSNMRHGDFALLPISSHVSLVDQNLATETMNVNPFEVITSIGHLEMSPASDAWVEIQYAPEIIVDGGTITRNVGRTTTTRNLNTWQSSWFGRPSGDTVAVITGSRVLRELVEERVVEVQVIPFMRSIKVFFRAQGLRPKTRHFPFFGGTNISNYAKSESEFTRIASSDIDPGNLYTNLTEHPGGTGQLLSDSAGKIVGSFIIPANDTLKFRTGLQEFKLLDISVDNDPNSISNAKIPFISSGILETRQRTIRSTRQLDLTWITRERDQGDGGGCDPLAQTFRLDQLENRSGVFITKIDLYFATKSTTGVPVQVQIRTVENGIPTGGPIPGAVKFLDADDVTAIGIGTTDLSTVQSNATTFEFEEPVYLPSGQEYAVVILAESTEYNVYVAKTYDFLLGSTEARVNKQPTLGVLFQSQNATTWSPDQTRDLMFKVYRADFASSATAILENVPMPKRLLQNNPFLTDSASQSIKVLVEGHGLHYGDKVYIEGLDEADSYAGIPGSRFIGSRTITGVDHTGFTFNADSETSDILRVGGNNVIISQNAVFNSYFPTVATMLPENVTLGAQVKLTSSESMAGDRNKVTSTNTKDTGFSSITLNELNVTNDPKAILNDSNEYQKLEVTQGLPAGTKSFTLQLDLATTDTKVSPVIDLQRMSVTGFENIIDKQDSAATSGFNVPLSFVAETHPTDGSSACKHVTTAVTLEEAAVGLKILLAANRPSTADFDVYYKIGTSEEVLDDKNWVFLAKEAIIPADNDGTTYREYEYLAGGVGGTLAPFTQYQVKVVLNTTNSSRPPKIKDLRAIALVT